MSNLIISPKTDSNGLPQSSEVFGYYDTEYGPLAVIACASKALAAGHAAAEEVVARFPLLLNAAAARRVSPRGALSGSVAHLDRLVFERSDQFQRSEVAVVFSLETDHGLLVGQVGRCQAFLARDGRLERLTRVYAEGGAGIVPAIGKGGGMTASIVAQPVSLAAGEGLLLCSPGLEASLGVAVMGRCIAAAPTEGAVAEDLIALARRRGHGLGLTTIYLARPRQAVSLPVRPAAAAAAAAMGVPRPAPARPPLAAAGRARPLISARLPLAVIGLALVILLVLNLRTGSPPVAEREREEAAPVMPIEIEKIADFDWPERNCPRSLIHSVKSMAGQFEASWRESLDVSDADELERGRYYLDECKIVYEDRLDTDAEWVDYLNSIGQTLVQGVKRSGIPYRFHFIDDETENAFALPGGHVFVFRGLLEKRIRNEAQLAFVLGHEIAHVDGRHSLAFDRLLQEFPDLSQDYAGSLIDFFINQPFEVNREEEADALGLKLATTAGYSPFQAVALLEERAASEPVESDDAPLNILEAVTRTANEFFQSHPSYRYRACRAKSMTAGMLRQGAPPFFYTGVTNFDLLIPISEQVY